MDEKSASWFFHSGPLGKFLKCVTRITYVLLTALGALIISTGVARADNKSACQLAARNILSERFLVYFEDLDAKYEESRELFTDGEILVHSLGREHLTDGTAGNYWARGAVRSCIAEEGEPLRRLYQERADWAREQEYAEKYEPYTPKDLPIYIEDRVVAGYGDGDIDALRLDIELLQDQLALVQQQRAKARRRYYRLSGWRGLVESVADGVNRHFAEADYRERIRREYEKQDYARLLEQERLRARQHFLSLEGA